MCASCVRVTGAKTETGSVTITTDSSTNGTTTSPGMNLSGYAGYYVGYVTIILLNVHYCVRLSIRVKVRIGVRIRCSDILGL